MTNHTTYHFRPLVRCIRGFFVLLIATLTWQCASDIEEVEETAARYEPAVERGKDITLLYNEEGQQRIKLTAPQIVQHKVDDAYVEFPEGLNVWFYNDSLQTVSTLTARYAIRYEKELQTIFRDSVVIHNRLGEEVYTEEMTWDEGEEKVYSDKFVRIITPDKRITGKGFEANQEFTEYTIQQITGQVYVQSDQTDENL